MPKTFCFPDIHFPYDNQVKINKALDFLANFKIGPKDTVVQLGDLYDQYSQSKYFRSLNLYTPKEEAEESYKRAKRFFKHVRKAIHSEARIVTLRGNHDVRSQKRLMEKCPELEHMTDWKGPYTFDGVETIWDPMEETEIDGVIYTHGWLSGGKSGRMPHARYLNQSVIHGHDHSAYINFSNFKKGHLFEMSCGLLADFNSLPLTYRATKTTHWVYAVGTCEVYHGRPYPHFFVL